MVVVHEHTRRLEGSVDPQGESMVISEYAHVHLEFLFPEKAHLPSVGKEGEKC